MAQSYIPSPIRIDSPGVIFFARHGQCKSNIEWPIEHYQDSLDTLTDIGILQAEKLGNFILNSFPNFTWKVVSSELTRAKETARIVNSILNGALLPAQANINEKDQKEDKFSFRAKIDLFMNWVSELELSDNERILVVTHGHVLENLILKAFDIDSNVIIKTPTTAGQKGIVTHANGGLSAFYSQDLLLWNFHNHLI